MLDRAKRTFARVCIFFVLFFVPVGQGHTFVLNKDGSLQALGYDVNSMYNDLTVKSNLTVQGGLINMSGSPFGTTFTLPRGVANSLVFASSSGSQLLHFDSRHGREQVTFGGVLNIKGGVLNFTGASS